MINHWLSVIFQGVFDAFSCVYIEQYVLHFCSKIPHYVV